MKKILLGTTAMVAAGLTAGQAMAADPIALQLGGYYRAAFYGTFSESDAGVASDRTTGASTFNGEAGANQNKTHFSTDGEVHFNGSTTLDNGIGVSVRIEMEVTDNGPGSTTDILDEHYLRLTGGFGTVQLGNDDTVGNSFSTTAPIGAGLFGVNSPTFVTSNVGGTGSPGSNSTVITLGGDSTGIRYTTPSFAGFQLGLSYQADGNSENSIQADGTNVNNSGLGDVYGAAVAFSESFAGVNISWSGSMAFADFDTPTANQASGDPWEWQSGLNVGFMGFTVGGSYKHQGDRAGVNGDSADIWDAGLTYSTGPVTVGLSMSQGSYNDDATPGTASSGGGSVNAGTYTLVQLGATYTLGPGVSLQGAVNWDEWDSKQTNSGNSVDARTLDNDDYQSWGGGLAIGLSF